MALGGVGEAYVLSPISLPKIAMARWFKEFPINFRNGADKIRSASESDSQNRDKPGGTVGTDTSPRGTPRKGSGAGRSGGVSCLLSGRNRKNSANESCRTVSKDEKVWESVLSGKSRKNSKSVAGSEEHNRTLKNCISASTYITRLIKVEKQDRIQTPSSPPIPCVEEQSKGTIGAKTETVIIREDYADPFDAQRTRKRNKSPGMGENDGYMEPYDAQQLITEIRRRGSKDLLREDLKTSCPLQLYDDPYDGVEETPVRKPDLDLRSPAEYELPWEWRREQILTALSVPFDDADQLDRPAAAGEQMAPHLSWPQMQHLQRWSLTQKTLRPPPSQSGGSSVTEGVDACRMDPYMPLEKQSWYHGSVTRQEVDSQLQSCKEGSFLVRDSESGTSKYSIALKTSQECVHIIVAQTKENGYTLDQSRCTFPTIPQVVHYYCTQPLPFPGANHMTLMHPVPRPL